MFGYPPKVIALKLTNEEELMKESVQCAILEDIWIEDKAILKAIVWCPLSYMHLSVHSF